MVREAQNPVADLVSLPFQNNMNFNVGPDEEIQNIQNIQPVAPFSIAENWNLITRTIMPLIAVAALAAEELVLAVECGDSRF